MSKGPLRRRHRQHLPSSAPSPSLHARSSTRRESETSGSACTGAARRGACASSSSSTPDGTAHIELAWRMPSSGGSGSKPES